VKAIVTGGASGLGAAIVSRLGGEGFDVDVLDLTTGFDVTDPARWDTVGPVEVACLNAGVLGGPADPAEITLESYRRAMAVNVDGVFLGVRRLAQVMPEGGRIVATASLAGLTSMPDDPVYAATKDMLDAVSPSLGVPSYDYDIPGNEVKLELYALYKQALEGDVQGKRPGFTDIIGRAKYDAWAKLEGTSPEQAMKRYAEVAEALSQ